MDMEGYGWSGPDDYADYGSPVRTPGRRSPWWWWVAYYVVMFGSLWVVYRALAGWPIETQNFILSIFHRIAG